LSRLEYPSSYYGLSLASTDLIYEGTRVKNAALGRELNPLGRGDGYYYPNGGNGVADGSIVVYDAKAMWTAGHLRSGFGSSINNQLGGGGGGGPYRPSYVDLLVEGQIQTGKCCCKQVSCGVCPTIMPHHRQCEMTFEEYVEKGSIDACCDCLALKCTPIPDACIIYGCTYSIHEYRKFCENKQPVREYKTMDVLSPIGGITGSGKGFALCQSVVEAVASWLYGHDVACCCVDVLKKYGNMFDPGGSVTVDWCTKLEKCLYNLSLHFGTWRCDHMCCKRLLFIPPNTYTFIDDCSTRGCTLPPGTVFVCWNNIRCIAKKHGARVLDCLAVTLLHECTHVAITLLEYGDAVENFAKQMMSCMVGSRGWSC